MSKLLCCFTSHSYIHFDVQFFHNWMERLSAPEMAQHPWIRKNLQLVRKRQKNFASAVTDVSYRYQTDYYKYIIKEPAPHLPELHVNTNLSDSANFGIGGLSPKNDGATALTGMIGNSCEKIKRTIKPKLSSKFIYTLNQHTQNSSNGKLANSESQRRKQKENLLLVKSGAKSPKSDKSAPVPSWARRWWTRHNDYNQPKVGVTC